MPQSKLRQVPPFGPGGIHFSGKRRISPTGHRLASTPTGEWRILIPTYTKRGRPALAPSFLFMAVIITDFRLLPPENDLIVRRLLLDVIDDDDRQGSLLLFQLQAELLFGGFEN